MCPTQSGKRNRLFMYKIWLISCVCFDGTSFATETEAKGNLESSYKHHTFLHGVWWGFYTVCLCALSNISSH